MAKPTSLEHVRQNHKVLLHGAGDEFRQHVSSIEERALAIFRAKPESLFGVEGHPVRDDVRQAVALGLHRHIGIRMPVEAIAAYLHLTQEDARMLLAKATTLEISGAGSATGADLMTFMQFFGPALSQVTRMI